MRPVFRLLFVICLLLCARPGDAPAGTPFDDAVAAMAADFGEQHRARLEHGANRVRTVWRDEDGSEQDMLDFIAANFVVDPAELDAAFDRLERVYEELWGRLHQVDRLLREPIHLDQGEIRRLDELLMRFSPYTHVEEDFYGSRVAFFIVLNFPHYSLEEKLRLGPDWDRRQWAMARLGDLFTSRVPAEVSARINESSVVSQQYVYDYYVHMDRVLTPELARPFPDGLRLIEHWGLRDEIRGRYTDPEGGPKQELIYRIMLRIVDQSIPAQVVGNDELYWEPHGNRLYAAADGGFAPLDAPPAPDVRYEHLLRIFRTLREQDRYEPDDPTVIDRVFNVGREIPAEEIERQLLAVVDSPETARLAALIEKRLGRPLRPYDIWYNGFKLAGSWEEEDLDAITKARYPTAQAFQDDLPDILGRYGFAPQTAGWLADRIVVDDSRGSGHAMGAEMRSDRTRLRTRVSPTGLDYKAYNIALHEMGHNVEQIFSLHGIDHYSLRGVPNNGFTEALAIMCQVRDLEILGVAEPDPATVDMRTLDTFLSTIEIGSVGLVELGVWRWLYAHPDATADELREAVLRIAGDYWNEHFAHLFGEPDCPLLAVYAHMLSDPTYLPNYAMGHVILFQIEDHLKGRDWASEVERMFRLGNLTPEAWLRQAVGARFSTEPLIAEAGRVLDRLEGGVR